MTRSSPFIIPHDQKKHGEISRYHNNKYHCDDGPARTCYYNYQITAEFWYQHGNLHREDGPACIFYKRGIPYRKMWYLNGKFGRKNDGPHYVEQTNITVHTAWLNEHKVYHRENGMPAVIDYDLNGTILNEKWYINGRQLKNNEVPSLLYKELDSNLQCITEKWIIHMITKYLIKNGLPIISH